jgi:hypothetical protein
MLPRQTPEHPPAGRMRISVADCPRRLAPPWRILHRLWHTGRVEVFHLYGEACPRSRYDLPGQRNFPFGGKFGRDNARREWNYDLGTRASEMLARTLPTEYIRTRSTIL